MGLIGNKHCASCDTKIGSLEVLRVSLGSKELLCKNCNTPFEFSDSRKWTAIFVVLIIVFAPTSSSVFLSVPYLTETMVLLLKYAIAVFLFILINGRASN